MKIIINFSIFIILTLSSTYSLSAEPKLLWEPSAGDVTGYRIYYGTAQGNYPNVQDVGNLTQYPLYGLPLQEEASYFFLVKAYNNAGESEASNAIQWHMPDMTPPIPPQNLSSQVTDDGKVLLNWTSNTEQDLKEYRVYQGTPDGAFGPPSPLGNTNTCTISGLNEGETYSFSVTAVDAALNESGYSKKVSISIPDRASPLPPIVKITSPTKRTWYKTRSSSVDLSGNSSDDVGVIQVTWVNSLNGQKGIAAGSGNWSASNIALEEGENIIFITAVDADGNSAQDQLIVLRNAASRRKNR